MKTTLLDARQIGTKLKQLISEFDEFYWSVAWGSDGPLADHLLANKKKIRNILIGIHFCQTDPKLLERLAPSKGTRVALSVGSGTFHPKIYYFQSGDQAAAIVGSANFTNAGVSGNTEAALLLEGKADDQPLPGIRTMVNTHWGNGSPIDSAWLTAYKLQHDASRRHREALSKPLRVNRVTVRATHPDLLTMSWLKFTQAIRNSPNHNLDGRLRMLRKARALLNGVDTFSDLTLDQRKAVAGIVGRKERFGNDLDDYDWGWFGSMFGAGSFRNRIGKNDPHLSAALEAIPPTGEVTEDDYQTFIDEFRLAFASSERQGGVPTASRLLAMKRPDIFLCVDNKNIRGMSDDLGFARTTLDFDRYWTEIIEPINQARWWQARRPNGVDGQIWDCRAAMLDAIYYEPT